MSLIRLTAASLRGSTNRKTKDTILELLVSIEQRVNAKDLHFVLLGGANLDSNQSPALHHFRLEGQPKLQAKGSALYPVGVATHLRLLGLQSLLDCFPAI